MAEVTAIINARPLTHISADADSPFPLTPAMKTQKVFTPLPPPGSVENADLLSPATGTSPALGKRLLLRDRGENIFLFFKAEMGGKNPTSRKKVSATQSLKKTAACDYFHPGFTPTSPLVSSSNGAFVFKCRQLNTSRQPSGCFGGCGKINKV